MAVRKALYNALMTEGHVSHSVMDAIKKQLLGVNGVRALKRDEVAVYIAAADADDVRGMDERITELRNRAIRKDDGVSRPVALKSKSDVAMELSTNEKLDEARMSLQKARVDLERYMAMKKVGGSVDGILDDFYKDFSAAFKGFALQDVPNAREKAGWERAIEMHTGILRNKIANGAAECENHDQIPDVLSYLDEVELYRYGTRRYEAVKAALRSAFDNNIEWLAPSTVDVVRRTALELGEEISIPDDDVAEDSVDNAAGSVAGRHFESDDPRSAVAEHMKAFLEAAAWQVRDAAIGDPKFARCGAGQKPSELMLRFYRHIKEDMNEKKVGDGESACVQALANVAGRRGKAFGGNIVPECKYSPDGEKYLANFSSGGKDPKARSCSFTLNLRMPVNVVGVNGRDYELTPECKEQTSVEYGLAFRLGFDEKFEPWICVDKSVEKVDMPDAVDGEWHEVKANESGAFAESKRIELHLEAPKEQSGVAEPHSDALPDRAPARPSNYRNVMNEMREWCKAARHVYTNTLSHRKPDERPNSALIGELYMEMAAFDGVKDLDAECPNARKLLDGGIDKLARRLVRVFGRHGVVMDPATARYAMKIHLDGIRKGTRT